MRLQKKKSRYQSYEYIAGSPNARIFLTCEHASAYFPHPWSMNEKDARLQDSHWLVDIGAARITKDLAHTLKAPAVLSRFSRIIVDANRDKQAENLILRSAENEPIYLNQNLDKAEYQRRIKNLYEPYHGAIDIKLGLYTDIALILSIHSFTPLWKGTRRLMEVGVLFSEETKLVRKIQTCLSDHGIKTALNEPYSGIKSMFSAKHHAKKHALDPLELEIRQDMAINDAWRKQLVGHLKTVLETV